LPTMGCAAALKLAIQVPSDTPHAPVLLPLRGRSRASCAPTASGQRQNTESPLIRFCAERVGVRLADDGLRSGPKTCDPGSVRHTACAGFTAAARQLVSKLRSYDLRPEAKYGVATNSLLPGARRSSACRRWAAQRPQNLRSRFRQTHRVRRFYCRCAADREQAALLRPPARGKIRSRH
jgi:hypothetical protein